MDGLLGVRERCVEGAASSRAKENSPEKSGEFHREEETLSYLYDDGS